MDQLNFEIHENWHLTNIDKTTVPVFLKTVMDLVGVCTNPLRSMNGFTRYDIKAIEIHGMAHFELFNIALFT